MNQHPVTEADLHAYLDGFLNETRQQEVADYLASRPQELQRIESHRAHNHALRALFNPVLDEVVPPHISAGLREQPVHFGRFGRFGKLDRFSRLAAGFCLALAGGVIGWTLHSASPAHSPLAQSSSNARAIQISSLPHQAAVAHAVYTPDVRRPVEIGADQEEALVKWLSKRLGSTMRPPSLGKLGYELVGGRLLPGNSGPVAQFMYQENSGRRLTLYVSTDQAQNTDTGFRYAQEGAINVFYWIDGKFGYALSGEISRNELAQVANAVYAQLDSQPH